MRGRRPGLGNGEVPLEPPSSSPFAPPSNIAAHIPRGFAAANFTCDPYGWGKTNHTLVSWRQGCSHPTKNQFIGLSPSPYSQANPACEPYGWGKLTCILVS